MIQFAGPSPDPDGEDREQSFLWIEDDGLLRDEGVVFGLSGAAPGLAYKEACIGAYFRRRAAEGGRERGALEAELQSVHTRIGELADRCDALRQRAPEPAAHAQDDDPAALVFRYSLGIVAAGGACAGTAALVFEQLRRAFDAPAMVTMGVVAAGFFTVFLPVSALFVNDREQRPGGVELWKVRLAEFGLPLVSAAFVTAWAGERLGPTRSLAEAALLFLVFVFAGRQLLSSVPRLGDAVRQLRRARMDRREMTGRAQQETALEQQGRDLEARMESLRRDLAAVRSDAEWEAIRDAKLALFRSEYELASASRTHAAPHPRASVLSTHGSH
ncbi:MAG TPA: hypothetical protein VFE05_19210 [Longimicrobiaceae bacterium]|jgi:hypothetical protein|nr:hypothetical protein [Longimicrobiaceae bacterium]